MTSLGSQKAMSLEVRGAVVTDSGRQRSVNEDWCGSMTPDAGDRDNPASVWAIADGVSGYGTGRDAARFAVEAVLGSSWRTETAKLEAGLRAAVEAANRDLFQRATGGRDGEKRYATTLVAAVIVGSDAWVVNVGNSRAYLIRSGTIRQVTCDHTWVAEQIAQGRLRPEEAANHPRRNVITRCLGQRATVQVDVSSETLEPDDRLLLCSDGLTRHASDEEIFRIARGGEPEVAARRLISLANERGGTDNVTVGVIELMHATSPQQRAERAVAPSQPAESPSRRVAGVGRIAALQEMSQRINASLELDETLRSVMDSLVEITGAERGFVMLMNEETNRLEFRIGRNLNAAAVDRDPEISRNMVDRVFQECQPLLIGDAVTDPEYRAFESVVIHAIRSVMCAPLMVKGRPIGVAYVDNSLGAELFDQEDLDLVTAFANMAASAIENARLHERLAAHVREIDSMKTAQDRILRSVSSGIISADRDGTITSYNRAAAEMLARPAEEAVGRALSAILPPRFMLALGPPLGGAGVEPGMTIQGFEMEGDLPGRGWVHLRHRLSPLRDESGATIGYVLALDDMTERERLDRARRQAAAEREKIKSVFEHYMAPAVFQELMRQGPDNSGIGGARREMTVLFADIRGFTKLSERLEPEHVVEILNGYLASATDVIFEHQGTIDKFIGDAIMALFGAPVQIENHPLEAVKAALAMQRRFVETPSKQGQRVSFGIGINSGPGVVGTIGAPQLMSYTVIGDVVNVAARLQGQARAGEILITDETYEQVSDQVVAEDLGPMDLKGRRATVNVYKVTGLRR